MLLKHRERASNGGGIGERHRLNESTRVTRRVGLRLRRLEDQFVMHL